MNTNDQTADQGDNTGLTRKKFLGSVATYGTAYGKGQNSRPAMAFSAVEAASKLTDVSALDAKEIYETFARSAAKTRGVEYAGHGSEKAQVSKLTQFLKVADNPNVDAINLFSETEERIKAYSARGKESPLSGSAYDNLVNVFRAQLKKPDGNLTAEEIDEVLTAEKEEKTAIDHLIKEYQKLEKLHELDGMPKEALPFIEEAYHKIGDAIHEAGGEIPVPKSKAEVVAELKVAQAKLAVLTPPAQVDNSDLGSEQGAEPLVTSEIMEEIAAVIEQGGAELIQQAAE